MTTQTISTRPTAAHRTGPALPTPRGPLSTAVLAHLTTTDVDGAEAVGGQSLSISEHQLLETDPFGLDLQVALYVCYELHYRGFAGVDPEFEWNPALLAFRRRLEQRFLAAVRDEVGPIASTDTAEDEMDALSVEPVRGEGPSHFLRADGSWEQIREYLALRSLYHLKEADPHAFAIPRLIGAAKAAFVAVEFDEYGGGNGERMHQQLFANLLAAAGLDDSYLGYLNQAPSHALATVNLMSMFGLHRSLRGAAVGHLAATEITSSPGARRLAQAIERCDGPAACSFFYREHVEADAVHEQVLRTDVVGDLVGREPDLESDVVFGMRAFDLVEGRLAEHVMRQWTAGRPAIDLS